MHAQSHRTIGVHDASGIRTMTFEAVAAEVSRVVERLRALGVIAGMRVGFLSDNCLEWITYDLALLELRSVAVALVDEVTKTGAEEAMTRFGLHLIVTDARRAQAFGGSPH